MRSGSNNFSTLVLAPLRDAMDWLRDFIGSERELTSISVAVPLMYKINDNLIAQVNIGVYIRYSYFQIIDNLTRYPYRSVVNYSKSFTLYDDDWSVIPTFEINSNISGSFFVFLGIEYNYNKSNFQITTDSENLNDFGYYQTYRTVKDFGDNLEYDYSGIGITLGLTYKI
ncbi:MAG: hypothetical protein K9I99_09910 [Melioribacteraceae bacterium]|nr:hypothetical protein [Melioribacteraceae bacterium]